MQKPGQWRQFWDKKKRQAVFRLVRCLLFFVLVFTSVTIYNNMVRQVPERYSSERFAGYYAEPRDSISVVGIGSSACNRYLDTLTLYEEFGITSYNLATPLQPPEAASFLMKEAEKTQRPELFIVEVREFLHLEGEDRCRAGYVLTDAVDLSPDKWRLVCALYPAWAQRLAGFFDFTTYHGSWTGLTEHEFAFWDNRVLSPVKSWTPLYGTQSAREPVSKGRRPLPLPEENERLLRELLQECREKNRRVLFVLNPYSCRQKVLRRVPSLRAIVEEYGYELLDLLDGNPCGINYETDMHDWSHVNEKGCVKVTRRIGAYISERYGIGPADLTEENRRVWEDCARAYREKREAYARGGAPGEESEDDFAL